MAQHVAFLRGINVGGHRASREQLCACFEELGFRDVATFRASGNVVFDAARQALAEMAVRIEAGLAKVLGYEVPTFLRTADEVRAIAAHRPFAPELVEASAGKLQVAFLPARPAAKARRAALALASDEDRLAIHRTELYWLPSGRMADSGLDLDAVEREVGPITMRTKNTVEQIAAKHLGG